MGEMTTTENIIRQMTKKEEKERQEDTHKPVMHSALRKGQFVEVYDDPTRKDRLPQGRAELRRLNDAKVYHEASGKRGFENWRVKFEDGEEQDRIIYVRDVVQQA